MRSAAALPFLLPADDTVEADGWRGPDGAELEERLEHWDPFTNLALVQVVTVHTDRVRSEAQLAADAALALLPTWKSDRTRLTGSGEVLELGTLSGTLRGSVSVDVPGPSVGGRLELGVSLVLRVAGSDPSPISARRPGAILWTRSSHVRLEGGAGRFPVTAVDFSTVPGLPPDGSWYLEWSTADLASPLSAAVRLLVNSAKQDLIGAVRSGATDPRSSAVRRFITYDTARTLAAGALTNDDFVADPETFEEGSLGRMLHELLAACWPGMPVSGLQARLRENPSRFDSELQANLGPLL